MSYAWYNERKAAQIAAFFTNKEGANINVVKLVKLIYLADRQHMGDHGTPMLNDRLVSMKHGPVNSMTYDCINGMTNLVEWKEFIGGRKDHNVYPIRVFSLDELDELSDFEISSLEKVWAGFGKLGPWELVDWTHDHCPEWEDPKGGASDIPHSRVFNYLNVEDPQLLVDELYGEREVESVFEKLRN